MEEATTAGLDANELKHVKVRGGGVGGYQDTGPGSCVCLVGDCLRILPWDSPQCKKNTIWDYLVLVLFFKHRTCISKRYKNWEELCVQISF